MPSRRAFLTSLTLAPLAPIPAKPESPTLPEPTDPGRMPSRIRAQDEADFWRELRREFTIPRHEAFFNTGTLGASPKVVQQAVIEHLRHVDRDLAHWDYQPDHEQFFTGYFPELRVREKVGAVINAAGRDVALTQNATFGMNFVAQGLDLAPGDEVVVTDQAHPGGRKGYDLRAKRHGIVLREIVVPDPPESPEQLVRLFLDATTERTRVWAIPHISSARAIRYPVGTLCRLARERGIWSVVDGAQSAGHLRVDVRAMGCDAFFGSPHKWLLAPKGTGFLYIRPERQREVWATLASGEWDNQDDPMFRLMQYGTGNLSLLRGLEKALEFHLEIGSDRIERRIMGLADRLRTGLAAIARARIVSPTHPELTCATTVYRIDGIPAGRVQDWLWERGRVRVRSVGDTVGVRHGCHIYNSEAEVDRALELLAELART